MDFNQSPPFNTRLPLLDFNTHGQFYASIADASGKLLFYTDGRTFYNNQHELMINGQGGYGDSRSTQTSIIIPKPGCKDLYYNFITELGSTNSAYSNNGWTIHYSIVDVAAANSIGRVVVKNRVLTEGKGDALAVFEGADGKSHWLVSSSGEKELLAYKITEAGISHCPVVTNVPNHVNVAYYNIKASPDSKHLVLTNDNYLREVLQVYRFDQASGLFELRFSHKQDFLDAVVYPSRYKRNTNYFEFSPDGKNLFVIEDSLVALSESDVKVYSSLFQHDLKAADNTAFEKSKVKIFDFPPGILTGKVGLMQLSPDGRLLMESFENYLSAITNPNAADDFNFVRKAVTFNDWPGVIPTFPAFFFKQGGYQTPPADGTCELRLCAGSMLSPKSRYLGDDYVYEWTNSKNSEVFVGRNPVLAAPQDGPETIYYYLKITDKKGCSTFDVMKVEVLPAPEYEITGSKSVCPGVEEVAYWVQGASDIASFSWSAEGGEIVSGQGTDSIQVNWGSPNPNAAVKLVFINNQSDCQGFLTLPVKVFKLLETEKPKGAEILSCEQQTYDYSILPTKGSYYNWHILNGEILEGQGQAKVKVAWNMGKERGYLWIEESVNTDLEVCFGRSDTLKVINPRATASQHIDLQFVSNVQHEPGMMELHYQLQFPQLFGESLTVYRRKVLDANDAWQEVAKVGKEESKLVFSEPLSNQVIYEYRIEGQHICAGVVESAIHNHIVLREPSIDENEQISLQWNSYGGWEKGVKSYELYRKLDTQDRFSFLLAADDMDKLELNNLSDGFEHCFYVKALSHDREEYYSFSNIVCLTFDHQLFIPNVFTPNGDGLNDYFEIRKIGLFPENELIIYNRHGKAVFQEKGYKNQWNGENLPEGVYFYRLMINSNKKPFKGWIQILR
jgi:gliding motility-associated-like protein